MLIHSNHSNHGRPVSFGTASEKQFLPVPVPQAPHQNKSRQRNRWTPMESLGRKVRNRALALLINVVVLLFIVKQFRKVAAQRKERAEAAKKRIAKIFRQIEKDAERLGLEKEVPLLPGHHPAFLKKLQSAYTKKAWQYHPDVNPGDPSASLRLAEINAAYARLKEIFGPDSKGVNL